MRLPSLRERRNLIHRTAESSLSPKKLAGTHFAPDRFIPRKYKHHIISREEFIEIWETANSRLELEFITGRAYDQLAIRATLLRREGVSLKEHAPSMERLDLGNLGPWLNAVRSKMMPR